MLGEMEPASISTTSHLRCVGRAVRTLGQSRRLPGRGSIKVRQEGRGHSCSTVREEWLPPAIGTMRLHKVLGCTQVPWHEHKPYKLARTPVKRLRNAKP